MPKNSPTGFSKFRVRSTEIVTQHCILSNVIYDTFLFIVCWQYDFNYLCNASRNWFVTICNSFVTYGVTISVDRTLIILLTYSQYCFISGCYTTKEKFLGKKRFLYCKISGTSFVLRTIYAPTIKNYYMLRMQSISLNVHH